MITILYLYDNAIVEDLQESFNPESVENPVVRVVTAEQIVSLAAQIQDDKIKFPIVSLLRDSNTPIDSERKNFTRLHKGISTVIDKETNNVYYEKMLPVSVSYSLTILTTNTADRDELVKELLFKYSDMYFLTIKLPYESNRKMRFGIRIDDSKGIDMTSGSTEYLSGGNLYQAIIPLVCEGCVLLSYTPKHLKRITHEITALPPNAKL